MKFMILTDATHNRIVEFPAVEALTGVFYWPLMVRWAEMAKADGLPAWHKNTPKTAEAAREKEAATARAWEWAADGEEKRRRLGWLLLAMVERRAMEASRAAGDVGGVGGLSLWRSVYAAHCAYRALVSFCHSDTAGVFTFGQKETMLKRARLCVIRVVMLAQMAGDSHNVVNEEFLIEVSG